MTKPTEVLRKIYTDLKLGGFNEIEPLLAKEEEAAKAFRKNTHKVRTLTHTHTTQAHQPSLLAPPPPPSSSPLLTVHFPLLSPLCP